MQRETDIVGSLIRDAGRRASPPEDAYQQVFVAAHAAFRDKTARRSQRRWLLGAGLAASVVLAAAFLAQWLAPPASGGALATIERRMGGVDLLAGDTWEPLETGHGSLGTGWRLRTRGDGRVALALAGSGSLRVAGDSEILLDAPGRVYLARGTIYFDSGEGRAGTGIEVVTPAGTARDVGTQFELMAVGAALRLRVREGAVAIDRGGRSLTGQAGEELSIDDLGGVSRGSIATDDPAWRWAEAIAPMPDMDGKPASALIAWVARQTGRRLHYESTLVEQRAAAVILHGDIRHLAPMEALEAMLATTDLVVELRGDTMEVRSRSRPPTGP